MNGTEFLNLFDILYNNLSSNLAPGLNSYEKSVLLTTAQEEILLGYFTGKNKYSIGFDGNDGSLSNNVRLFDFANLIQTVIINNSNNLGGSDNDTNDSRLNSKAHLVTIDDNLLDQIFIPLLKFVLDDVKALLIPITTINYALYQQQMLKPYPYPPKKQAWEILVSKNEIEVLCPEGTNFNGYKIRYVRRPYPIILEDLTEGEYKDSNLTINGETLSYNGEQVCEVNELLHLDILKRAVELAIAAYKGQGAELLTIGSVSSTELGGTASNNNL